MRFIKFIIASVFLVTALSAAAVTYPIDNRAQLPREFNDSYMGLGAGYTDIPYSNKNLMNNIQAGRFSNPDSGLNVYVGHYFNSYLAAQVSLMRPIEWANAENIPGINGTRSIWVSVFGLSVRPTLPLSKRWSVYVLAGLGMISRHGFDVNGVVAMPSKVIPTVLTGGGVSAAMNNHWHWTLGVDYALARMNQHQPSILYVSTGFYYLFHPLHLPDYYTSNYIFPDQVMDVGAFSTSIFNPNINKYFSIHYLPIFWTGDVHTRVGETLLYTKNIFHTHKRFSLDVGGSVSHYESKKNKTSFETFSVFPDIRYWFLRSRTVDMYFMYSVAGPTYITHRVIDGLDTGGHFTFQDLLGVGFFFGQEKNVNLDFRIGHYSNGNSLPNNPGIQVPLTVSVGYVF